MEEKEFTAGMVLVVEKTTNKKTMSENNKSCWLGHIHPTENGFCVKAKPIFEYSEQSPYITVIGADLEKAIVEVKRQARLAGAKYFTGWCYNPASE